MNVYSMDISVNCAVTLVLLTTSGFFFFVQFMYITLQFCLVSMKTTSAIALQFFFTACKFKYSPEIFVPCSEQIKFKAHSLYCILLLYYNILLFFLSAQEHLTSNKNSQSPPKPLQVSFTLPPCGSVIRVMDEVQEQQLNLCLSNKRAAPLWLFGATVESHHIQKTPDFTYTD